ncbi:hypothetical protein [Promicromonospora sp. MEB111]|uniref:hypothetical protein n=1 Tax=Promicromonospora sp. MEB111 TaxID=3040301 RepID=UPI00254E16BF|nr:hypothetical protein [Promicromonospora sp. MEB111]
MTSAATGGESVWSETTGGAAADAATQFRAVLDAEERWLGAVSRAGDFTVWRSRVVREVMDRRSPYAMALRRAHGAGRQAEFLQSWQALIAETVQRIAPGRDTCALPTATSAASGHPESLAVAILASLHGGATLSWLAQDARSLEAALDIVLTPVLALEEPDGRGDQRSG